MYGVPEERHHLECEQRESIQKKRPGRWHPVRYVERKWYGSRRSAPRRTPFKEAPALKSVVNGKPPATMPLGFSTAFLRRSVSSDASSQGLGSVSHSYSAQFPLMSSLPSGLPIDLPEPFSEGPCRLRLSTPSPFFLSHHRHGDMHCSVRLFPPFPLYSSQMCPHIRILHF